MAVGVEVGAVLRVTVAISSGAETFTIIVDNHRTEDDFITSVPIDIADGEVVEAVAIPWACPSLIIAPRPRFADGQLMGGWIDIEGAHLVLGVATTSEEDAGLASIQIRSTEIVLAGAVPSVVLPPHYRIVALSCFKTRQRIIHRGESGGCVCCS